MTNYIKPTSDLAAKKLFQDPVASKGFLKTFLGIDAKEVTLLNTQNIHLKNNDSTVPFSTLVDVLVGLEDGTQVVVEIQSAKQNGLVKRAFAYACERQVERLEKLKALHIGQDSDIYNLMTPIYVVVVSEKNYFENDNPVNAFSLKNTKTGTPLEEMLPDKVLDKSLFQMVFLELSKYNKGSFTDEEFGWFSIFLGLDIPETADQAIKSAKLVLDKANFSEEELIMLSKQERHASVHHGEIETARDDGREEGAKSKALETARNLIKNLGLTPQVVAENTGITLEEALEIEESLTSSGV